MDYVHVPFTAVLYSEEGTVLCHYSNLKESTKQNIEPSLWYTTGEWVSGEPTGWGEAVLSYYNADDPGKDPSSLGWRTNRQLLPFNNSGVKQRKSWARVADGQYIKYPPQAGYLEIQILTGIHIYTTSKFMTSISSADAIYLLDDKWKRKLRWMLYQPPVLEVVKRNLLFEDFESDDVEYSGILNADAKEEISIDTICGTMADICPTAKGLLFRTDNVRQIRELTRSQRTTQAEQLLIGTLYSQYAERKTLLSGTAGILSGDISVYKEACQDSKRFICLSDTQNIITGESKLEIVELRPDEYKSDND